MNTTPSVADRAIARMVCAAARLAATWGNKAFISDVCAALPQINQSKLRARLPVLHRHGLITLSRADLPSLMPADKVRESEISIQQDGRDLATWHFIVAS